MTPRALVVTMAALLMAAPHAGAEPAAPSPIDYRSAWECDASKFNWYCDDHENLPAPLKPAEKPAPKKPPSIQDMKTTKEINAELERLKDLAIMNPTEENVKAFASGLEYMMSKASLFTDVYRRVSWQTPELNHTELRPHNTVGMDTYNVARNNKKTQSLAALAKDNGLFFFFKSDCPYCHKLAPTVKLLQSRHGMEIFPVSLDGKGLPDFPGYETDRGAAKNLGVDRVPALLLVSKTTGKVQAVSFGMISFSEIEERIYVLTQTKPGEEF
jgi:conjugal transfer pilus assembly protein TraF